MHSLSVQLEAYWTLEGNKYLFLILWTSYNLCMTAGLRDGSNFTAIVLVIHSWRWALFLSYLFYLVSSHPLAWTSSFCKWPWVVLMSMFKSFPIDGLSQYIYIFVVNLYMSKICESTTVQCFCSKQKLWNQWCSSVSPMMAIHYRLLHKSLE